ncbi:signal peptidase I [Patescibacteria group bacterium]|nr:signal peptidase I [Patescibacteria group bacterium]
MRKILSFFWEVAKIGIIAAVIVVPIRYFLFQPFFVRGQSMEPSFYNSDYLVVDEISYRFKAPQRGEVIVFKFPNDPSQRYIKRIIGLPGETVEVKDGKVVIFIEDSEVETLDESDYLSNSLSTPGNIKIILDENEYFVLGDNRIASSDSRSWGSLSKEYIIGRVFFRAFPFAALAKIEAPSY